MNLKEYQAKHFLQNIGFDIPRGVHCESADSAQVLAETLDTDRWVVKAQILAGGRARGYFTDETASLSADKANRGGVQFARSPQQIFDLCIYMLGNTLVTAHTGSRGEEVRSVYLEAQCDVAHELYIALTTDAESGQLAFILSRNGGTEIESVAANDPASVYKVVVPVGQDFQEYDKVCSILDIQSSECDAFNQCLKQMIEQFIERDMRLIEINPLARLTSGELVALDAMVVFDDNALFRQGHPEQMEAYAHLTEQECAAIAQGINFINLDGNIATFSSGAGLAMATIDAICQCGGQAANFLDVPPSLSVARLKDAVDLALHDGQASCLLINVFGGGIMRCDAVADALLLRQREKPIDVPVIARLAGTNADLARQRLQASMPDIILADNLAEAARLCCERVAVLDTTEQQSDTTLWRRIKRKRARVTK